MPIRSGGCEFQSLESRLFFAATPASPRANSLGKAFDVGERQTLLDRMSNIDATTRSSLQKKLNVSVGQFDSALLSYMRTRPGPNFFFKPSDAGKIGSFIANNKVGYSDLKQHSDQVTDSRLFPDQGSSADFTVKLPASINWVKPGGS